MIYYEKKLDWLDEIDLLHPCEPSPTWPDLANIPFVRTTPNESQVLNFETRVLEAMFQRLWNIGHYESSLAACKTCYQFIKTLVEAFTSGFMSPEASRALGRLIERLDALEPVENNLTNKNKQQLQNLLQDIRREKNLFFNFVYEYELEEYPEPNDPGYWLRIYSNFLTMLAAMTAAYLDYYYMYSVELERILPEEEIYNSALYTRLFPTGATQTTSTITAAKAALTATMEIWLNYNFYFAEITEPRRPRQPSQPNPYPQLYRQIHAIERFASWIWRRIGCMAALST